MKRVATLVANLRHESAGGHSFNDAGQAKFLLLSFAGALRGDGLVPERKRCRDLIWLSDF
jgi:hypothetical protein